MLLVVLNKNFENVGIVDEYKSLIWTERYYECGDFQLEVPATSYMISLLSQDYYLYSSETDVLMIIEEIQINTDVESGNYLLVSGRSLESILDRRIIWNQTVLSGNVESCVKKLITENIISPKNSDRKIANFKFKNSTDAVVRNEYLEAQFTGDNLYDAICKICQTYEFGFRITLEGTNFVFQLYYGADRSYAQKKLPYIVYSPKFDNIISSDYLESKKNYKNVTLVAGEGEGAEQKTKAVGKAKGIDRRELYTEAKDISTRVDSETELTEEEYYAQLEERGYEELSDYQEMISFDAEIDYDTNFIYGQNYLIGDIVQIVNEYGIEARSRVIEYIRSHDESGSKAYPTFMQTEIDYNGEEFKETSRNPSIGVVEDYIYELFTDEIITSGVTVKSVTVTGGRGYAEGEYMTLYIQAYYSGSWHEVSRSEPYMTEGSLQWTGSANTYEKMRARIEVGDYKNVFISIAISGTRTTT